jgi:hypothetical protein
MNSDPHHRCKVSCSVPYLGSNVFEKRSPVVVEILAHHLLQLILGAPTKDVKRKVEGTRLPVIDTRSRESVYGRLRNH